MGTSVERASAVSDIRQKAEGYGMKNDFVDGMDIIKVREKAELMIEAIRAGEGPQFLEVITYRFRGHSMGDPERYRKQDEIHKWQENDPIGSYRKYLLKNKIVSEDALNKEDDKALEIVEEAVKFAESSPEPAAEELFRHIYVEEGR
jgi:pyruvate dehydrogenase E1 component alpha subunit